MVVRHKGTNNSKFRMQNSKLFSVSAAKHTKIRTQKSCGAAFFHAQDFHTSFALKCDNEKFVKKSEKFTVNYFTVQNF